MADVSEVLSEELQTAMRLLGAKRAEDLNTQHVSLASITCHCWSNGADSSSTRSTQELWNS